MPIDSNNDSEKNLVNKLENNAETDPRTTLEINSGASTLSSPETNQSETPEIYTVKIEALTTEGQGIARIAAEEGDDTRGFTIFCDGLLPGEEAEVRIVSRKKKYLSLI